MPLSLLVVFGPLLDPLGHSLGFGQRGGADDQRDAEAHVVRRGDRLRLGGGHQPRPGELWRRPVWSNGPKTWEEKLEDLDQLC